MRSRLVAGILFGFVLTGAVGGALSLVQVLRDRTQHRKAAEANAQNVFWAIVAGRSSGVAGSGPGFRLARDLNTLLGPIGAGQTTLPPAILSFRGNVNGYGGASRALGFDPFDETGQPCHDCGPLSQEMLRDLLLVKTGQDFKLLQDTTVAPGPALWKFWFPWLGLLVVVAVASARNAVVRRMS
jgi:hypothetical protein